MTVEEVWPSWHAQQFLGRGSYGEVYRIYRDEMGHRSLAAAKHIEIPHDSTQVDSLSSMGMDSQSMKAYFKKMARDLVDEIAVMESLKGARNVVFIEDYQLFEHADDIGWSIWIRMELLEGINDYQRRTGIPNMREVAKIGRDLCNALDCCHELDIIHRDVKPENVFHSKFGEYKLGDFGISKQLERSNDSVYSRIGTPPYMAPEVFHGKKYDKNVDLYSLGIMLYRYLNGMRFPFLPPAPRALTPVDFDRAIARRLSGAALPAPAEADEELGRIVLRACEADPERRYHTAAEMREDLSRWLHNHKNVPDKSEDDYPTLVAGAEDLPRGGDSDSGESPIPDPDPDPKPEPLKLPKLLLPVALAVVALLVIGSLLIPALTSGNQGQSGGDSSNSSNSEYVGEWYVPTDTDRRITIGANGDVSYGDDNHGTIAAGTWAVIDEDAGAIKFTLKAEDGYEQMFEEGAGEFTRMAYAESAEKMSAQMYYSPTEWETYVRQS